MLQRSSLQWQESDAQVVITLSIHNLLSLIGITIRWIGFAPQAPVCGVCDRSPAELECRDCGGGRFCKSCFKVFHSKGRKRKHQSVVLKEEIASGFMECFVCERRAATETCEDCSTPCCNSCLECVHLRECSRRIATQRSSAQQKVCVSCGEEADQKCQQCGDLYCSRTWMGNPGCFLSYHSKGNRVSHTTVSLFKIEAPEEQTSAPRESSNKKFSADSNKRASTKKSAKSKAASSKSPTRSRPGVSTVKV